MKYLLTFLQLGFCLCLGYCQYLFVVIVFYTYMHTYIHLYMCKTIQRFCLLRHTGPGGFSPGIY